MLKAPELQGAAELAKGHKRIEIEKYFAYAYPLSKLVQTVIQSQSCFSIVVLGAAGKILLGCKVTSDRPRYNEHVYSH